MKNPVAGRKQKPLILKKKVLISHLQFFKVASIINPQERKIGLNKQGKCETMRR
jgi:hypothetical protein